MSTDTGHHTDAAQRELIPTGHPSLDDLRTIDLLAELSDEQLQRWSDAAELYEVQDGSTISREGEESLGTILVFEGTLHGTMRQGDREEPLSDQVGPTWVGAIQTLTGDLNTGLTLVPLCIALGAAAHIAGDELTHDGCPLAWPVSGHEFHLLPHRLQITTGRFAEHWIVSTLLLAGLGYLLWRDTGMGAFVHHAHIMRTAAL